MALGKKMIVIAEITFALLFIILLSLLFGKVYNFGSNANDKIEAMRAQAAETEVVPYNGTVVSGDSVISAINKLKETDTGLKMSYAVCQETSTASQSNWYYYGAECIEWSGSDPEQDLVNSAGDKIDNLKLGSGTASGYSEYNIALRPSDEGFISPVAEYNADLAFNVNGVLVGVVFILSDK